MTPTAAYRMRSCRLSRDRATRCFAALALIRKNAAVSPKTYMSPYQRMAIGPSLNSTGSMSGFGNTGGHPTEVRGTFQARRLDEQASFRYTERPGRWNGRGGSWIMALEG